MQQKYKALAVSLVLFAALIAIGYSAISSSSYMDVSSLLKTNTKSRVVVEGKPVVLGTTTLLLKVNNTVFKLEARGVYGVAYQLEGPQLGNDNSYAVFILSGKQGGAVAALYSAKEFVSKYGSRVEVSSRVVVEGTYLPSTTVTVYDATGRLLGEYPLLLVTKILEGCHESYKQPVGTIKR